MHLTVVRGHLFLSSIFHITDIKLSSHGVQMAGTTDNNMCSKRVGRKQPRWDFHQRRQEEVQ